MHLGLLETHMLPLGVCMRVNDWKDGYRAAKYNYIFLSITLTSHRLVV